MGKNLILEDLERAFGKDSAQFKFFIRSIRDFPKGFEMPIRSLEDFEKMVRTLPCSNVDNVPKPACPHCRALALIEKWRLQEEAK